MSGRRTQARSSYEEKPAWARAGLSDTEKEFTVMRAKRNRCAPKLQAEPTPPSLPDTIARRQAAVDELIDGCEQAVFRHRVEEVHQRRVVHLGMQLIGCAGYAAEDLIHVDPELRDHIERCLDDIEDRLALALKQYRKIFSHVGVEISAWGQR